MADNYNIYRQCTICLGSGVITVNDEVGDPGPPTEVTCTFCNGDGELFWGEMREEE